MTQPDPNTQQLEQRVAQLEQQLAQLQSQQPQQTQPPASPVPGTDSNQQTNPDGTVMQVGQPVAGTGQAVESQPVQATPPSAADPAEQQAQPQAQPQGGVDQAALQDMTKDELAQQYGVSVSLKKDEMIAEIVNRQQQGQQPTS